MTTGAVPRFLAGAGTVAVAAEVEEVSAATVAGAHAHRRLMM